MRSLILFLLFSLLPLFVEAQLPETQLLPGFKVSPSFDEQQMIIEDSPAETRILINAPVQGFEKNNQVLLVFYALPNGNTIEQTFGKVHDDMDEEWQYNIQHIGAQTRFLRKVLNDQTVIVACLEASQLSWPLWKKNNPRYLQDSKRIVDEVTGIFSAWNPRVVLNGHSGGGRFIFSYLEAEGGVPDKVERIAFLDSDYGYEDTIHGPMLVRWLKSSEDKFLCTLAYNDSVVIYKGRPLVSPTGGTWYRSKMMKEYLATSFPLREEANDTLIRYSSPENNIEFILRTNPEKKIYHSTQVELNGFIHSMLSGTKHEEVNYSYFGERAYSGLISDSVIIPVRKLNIPPRDAKAEPGSSFMKRIEPLSPEEREKEIYKALSAGNMPDFLRETITVRAVFTDSGGTAHRVQYEVMPDYLSVGSDSDYCRIPMNPNTAGDLANKFGASLLTSKLSDHIFQLAPVKLNPFPYAPVGNENETVAKFIEHNAQIEIQKEKAGGKNGQLIAGIKKDVILSCRMADQADRVVIYGWHRPDGTPIQPVYSGHVFWYVDYSHGIRLINNQVLIDGQPCLLTDVLSDPVLYKIFSDEDSPIPKNDPIRPENTFQSEYISPQRTRKISEGHYLFDFGKDAFGTLSIKLNSKQKAKLIIHLGEKLNNSGTIDRKPGGSIRYQKEALAKLPEGSEVLLELQPDKRNTGPRAIALPDSFGVIMPFRYCEIENLDVPLSDMVVRQKVYHYRFNENASEFSSSDTLLNHIWDLCKYSIKATSFCGLYIDGDRERIPYEADAYINQLSHYAVDSEYGIAKASIEHFFENPTWPTEWLLHTVLMVYQDYYYTGETELLKKYYEPLKAKTLYELAGDDGLISSFSENITGEYMQKLGFADTSLRIRDIVDWPPAQKDTGWKLASEEGERDGHEMMPVNTVVNCFFYENMRMMAELAGVLHKAEDAEFFARMALKVKRSINEKLLNREKGVYTDGAGSAHSSLHSNMLPLAFGLVPDDFKRSVIDFIKSRKMACSVYGAQYLLEGLYHAGEEDYALELMTSTSERSWWNMIRSGSSITMEAWDMKYKPNSDWNHAWGSAPGNIISRYMWGIKPALPGFERVEIKPQLSTLEFSKIKVPSAKGPILAEYEQKDNGILLYTIQIPDNMEGELILNTVGSPLQLKPGVNRFEVPSN